MYKMYKKDRGQWVVVATFDSYMKASVYARAFGFKRVDNPNEEEHYYFGKDTWQRDYARLKEPLTQEQLDNLEEDPQGMVDEFGVALCRRCGELLGINYTRNCDYIEIDGNYYCDSDCAENDGCFYCECCSSWYDSGYDHYETYDGRIICEDCKDNYYYYCDECGNYVHQDEAEYDDWNDRYYCPRCWEDHEEENGIIDEYHGCNRPPIEIQRTEEDTEEDNTFGTETETECTGSSPSSVAEKVNGIMNKQKELVFFEHDGSLDHGYETITQPFTMRWFKKNCDLFEKMFSTMTEMGCRSHDTDTCGLHVHFGRHFFKGKSQECIDRLIYIFERYKPQLEKFSRRRDFNWCRFPSNRAERHEFYVNDEDELNNNYVNNWKRLSSIKKCRKSCLFGHNNAINLENEDTIEIRLFKGTLNFSTYYATLELVNNLTTYVRDKSDNEVEQGNFEDIINYLPTEHLKQYCLEKQII